MDSQITTILILTAIILGIVVLILFSFGYQTILTPVVKKIRLFFKRKKQSSDNSRRIFSSKVSLAIAELSQNKIGALILIERKEHVQSYIDLGVKIDAEIQPQMIVALFQKNSPLHDGALVIRDDRIISVASYLPVTKRKMDSSYGSRHRAALGASEQTDVLAFVVSETNGKISYAVGGKLHKVQIYTDVANIIFEKTKNERN